VSDVDTPALTTDVAARWRRARVPRWIPKAVLPALWVGALGVWFTELGTAPVVCTVEVPCAPDPLGAALFVVLLAVPLALAWWPEVGCLYGAVITGTVVASGDVEQTTTAVAFVIFGAACVAVGISLQVARRRQRRLMRAVGRRGCGAAPSVDPAVGPRGRRCPPVRLAGAALMALLAVVAAGLYAHEVRSERAAIARSWEVPGKVVDVTAWPFPTATLVVDTPDGPREFEVTVIEARSYAEGQVTMVLLDPEAPDRVRLVAEPADPTPWLALASLCSLLAMFAGIDEGRARRARRRLSTARHPAVHVRVAPGERGRARVWATDEGAPVASFRGRLHRLGTEAGRPADDALLVGDLRDGGWAMLELGEGIIMPDAPLKVLGLRSGKRCGPPTGPVTSVDGSLAISRR
jgi:hypothetical protein